MAAALTFVYAPPLSNQYDTSHKENDSALSKLTKTCQSISANRGCQISIDKGKSQFIVCLTGDIQSLMLARGDLLKDCPLKVQLTINIPASFKLDLILEKLETIQIELDIDIQTIPGIKEKSSLITDNMTTIHLIGVPAKVEQARIKVLVCINAIIKHQKNEIINLPLKLQYLMCGKMRANLLPIIQETGCNIFFPSPFTPIFDEGDLPINITGNPTQVSRVRDMLLKSSVQKAKSMYHKDTALDAKKIDWLLLHNRDELHKIMHDNGAFIQFPLVGSGDTKVTVFAENRISAERALRALNHVASQIYQVFFVFNKRDDRERNFVLDDLSNVCDLCSELSQISNCEIVYESESGCLEALGPEREIRNVYQRLQSFHFEQNYNIHTTFRVESCNEQRDFVSGKKNGKINKIMKISGVTIKFLPYINDYNFIIEVVSSSFTKAFDGLTLLQEELPAEISFYVPESYHKRIIGVGGSIIQRIMKKYGVYVKFSNTEEFASLGGYHENQDNVVARTPMKNHINLENLRHTIMESVFEKDRNYIRESVSIPFYLHAELIQQYQDFFDKVLKETNTQILWPDAELASSNVQLLGPEKLIPEVTSKIDFLIQETFDLHFPCTENIYQQLIENVGFHSKVVDILKQKHDVHVKTNYKEDDGTIRLTLARFEIRTPKLKDALDTVIDYLKSQNIYLYEGTTSEALAEAAAAEKNVKQNNHATVHEDTSTFLKQISPNASISTPNSSSSAPRMTGTICKSSSTTLLHNNTIYNSTSNTWSAMPTHGLKEIFNNSMPEHDFVGRPPFAANMGLPTNGNDIWSTHSGNQLSYSTKLGVNPKTYGFTPFST